MNVSVVIPTYKRPKMLEESVISVWEQTRLPSEILIGDDSPDTETEKLIRTVLEPASPVPIHYFRNQPSLGEGRNVDMLFRKVRGEAILLMHDDDPLYPRCIEALMAPLEEDAQLAASFGLQHMIDEMGNLTPDPGYVNRHYFRTSDRAGSVDGLFAGAISMFPNNGFVVRTELARKVGYDDGGWSGYARDFSFRFRLGRMSVPVFFVDELVSKCRRTLKSESRGNPKADNAYRVFKILLAELSDDFKARPEVSLTLRRTAPLAITFAAQHARTGESLRWLFGPYYRHLFLTPRWWKRFMITILLSWRYFRA
jgi:GT2 family glycosyltransferase